MATARINFTKAALDRLPLPAVGERDTYHDIKTPGLQLRVSGSGVKTFSVFCRTQHGAPERVTLRRYPGMSIEQARNRAAEISAEIASGKSPAGKLRLQREELTLGKLFEEYIERHAIPHGKKTIQAMRDNFRRYLGDLGNPVKKPRGRLPTKPKGSVNWQERRLSQIHRSEVVKLHNALGKHSGHYAANRAVELLSAIYNKAIKWGHYKGDNPAHGVEPFKEASRERFAQPTELRPLFDSIALEPDSTLRDYFLISLLTGARRGNVLAMRWDQLDLERALWVIPETKNGTPQSVPLVPEAVSILTARRDSNQSEWVFPGPGNTGHLASPKRAWRRALLRANISDLRLHDLRRTLGSYQARTGASLVIIGKALNHKSPQSTTVYARLDLDPVRQSIERATSDMLQHAGKKAAASLKTLSPIRTRSAQDS